MGIGAQGIDSSQRANQTMISEPTTSNLTPGVHLFGESLFINRSVRYVGVVTRSTEANIYYDGMKQDAAGIWRATGERSWIRRRSAVAIATTDEDVARVKEFIQRESARIEEVLKVNRADFESLFEYIGGDPDSILKCH